MFVDKIRLYGKMIFFLMVMIAYWHTALAQNGKVDHLLKEMKWRNLGPANFAGRIVDVEAVENDFTHVIVASASGGVWKSTNAGITWQPIFNDYGSASIGDIKVFQKNPDILWIGTGEANNRNSVAWGDGIYKSTDGGKTFQHKGLRETYQIARIVTHPQDENTVYVAAIGYLWGYSGDRGLFKTSDGGETWTKLTNGLPNDGKTGAIDLVMDPTDPNTLFVAFYQRLRKPYRFDSGGPNGGIFQSTDGGQSWRKLTNGLPTGETGRIGLDIYRKNPKIIMAIIEHGFQPQPYQEDYANMEKLGTGIYRSEDGGETWQYVNRYNNRPFYYSQIRINPQDDRRVYVLSTTIRLSDDGG
ncbi:MAG: WD40/YVTN/BNR-like repeat-containing protein, partial [bacterium]